MMKSSIRRRVLLLALLPATLLALSLGYFFTMSRITDLDQALRTRGMAIARHLGPASEYDVFSGNQQILQRLADSAGSEPDVIAVSILNHNGRLLASNGLAQNNPYDGSQRNADNLTGSDTMVTVATRFNSLIFRTPIHQTEVQVDDCTITSAPQFASTRQDSAAPSAIYPSSCPGRARWNGSVKYCAAPSC